MKSIFKHFKRPVRVWVNQPSTSQPDHEFHGKVGIAIPPVDDNGIVDVFFTDGPIVSSRMFASSLSDASGYEPRKD